MLVRVCCYVELAGGRGTPEGIVEAERLYGSLPMARKVSSSTTAKPIMTLPVEVAYAPDAIRRSSVHYMQ